MEAIKHYLTSTLNESVLSLINEKSICTITDSIGRLEYASSSYCELIQCDFKRLIGEPHSLWRSRLHSNLLYKNLWQTIKKGHIWKNILSETLENGSVIYLDTTIIPLKNNEGKSLKYIAVYHDVTALQHQKNKLAKMNMNQSKFLEAMPFHAFLITKHGKILNTNKSYRHLEIYDLIDTYIYDYIETKYFEDFKACIDFVFTEKVKNKFNIKKVDAKGNPKTCTVIVSPVFDELRGVFKATVIIQEDFQQQFKEHI